MKVDRLWSHKAVKHIKINNITIIINLFIVYNKWIILKMFRLTRNIISRITLITIIPRKCVLIVVNFLIVLFRNSCKHLLRDFVSDIIIIYSNNVADGVPDRCETFGMRKRCCRCNSPLRACIAHVKPGAGDISGPRGNYLGRRCTRKANVREV